MGWLGPGSRIPDQETDLSRISDPEVKKAPDPGSILYFCYSELSETAIPKANFITEWHRTQFEKIRSGNL
jgi:hypothetical protein